MTPARFLFPLLTLAATATLYAVPIQLVPVADAGNAPDPLTGHGSVPYAYQIGKYDVTVSQYVEFLNARDPTAANTLGLYNPGMSTDPHVAGVALNPAAPAGTRYTVLPGQGNKPITYVSWYSTLRFANWLNNGQGNADTESGAYTLQGGTPTPANAASITRNPTATIVLPTEDEWYKAAYYKGGGATAGYWLYATRSDTVPQSVPPRPTAANAANYDSFTTGYALTGSLTLSDSQNYLTDVGAYGNSPGPYGTFDQAGDVFQWNQTLIDPAFRGQRGSSWANCPCMLPSTSRNYFTPTLEDPAVGFRVASVPEPAGTLLVLVLTGPLFRRRKRDFAQLASPPGGAGKL
ncbi:MAG TPA: SUMF1/EgtB/PvdO family nonheme iron enzyme [Tepidisphaeraceae bacterium]